MIYSIVLPVVVFAAFYLPAAVSFIAGQACFTMVIVVLFNLLKPSGWTLGLVRLEDVLIGATIGLVIGMAIWPRGASSELARVVGRLFLAGGGYAQATVSHVVDRPSVGVHPEDVDMARRRDQVCIAAVDAEDVFSQYLSEPHQSDAPVMAWSSLIASAHQLWFGSSVVGLVPKATGAARKMPEVCDELLASSAAMARTYRSLADALMGQERLEVDEPPAIDGTIDRSSPDGTMTLLELEAWLAELAAEMDRTRPALHELGLGAAVTIEAEPSPAHR